MQYSERDLQNAPAFQPSQIREDVTAWLERLGQGKRLGRFAFCERGGLVPTTGPRAHMPTVFAMKIAFQIGLWARWPKDLRESATEFVRNAQGDDGAFVDPWLQASARLNWRDWCKVALGRASLSATKAYYADWRRNMIRAETRQGVSALLMVGALPRFAPAVEVKGYEDTRRFLDGLDWSMPWGAGSHLSHLIMLTSVGEQMASTGIDHEAVRRSILDFLASIHHKGDGAWYRGENVSSALKINGAMKVFSGLQWIEHSIHDHRRLIDLVLSEPFYSDGCHFTNSLFVLHQINRIDSNGYRREEIMARARLAASCLMLHKKAGAGFSFLQKNAQRHYYTATVSKGYDEADLHGTVMYTWACAIIVELLKEDYPDEAQFWQPQVA